MVGRWAGDGGPLVEGWCWCASFDSWRRVSFEGEESVISENEGV